jgi:hypothetical protein
MSSQIFVRSNRYVLITPDGSSYYSINSSDNICAYDYVHINAISRFIVHNRYSSFHTIESLTLIYSNALSIP